MLTLIKSTEKQIKRNEWVKAAKGIMVIGISDDHSYPIALLAVQDEQGFGFEAYYECPVTQINFVEGLVTQIKANYADMIES